MNLLLLSAGFPKPHTDQFLEPEYKYLQNSFDKIRIHTSVNLKAEDYSNFNLIELPRETRIRNLLKKYFFLTLGAWSYEFLKSKNKIYYIRNFKKLLAIWLGYLKEADKWDIFFSSLVQDGAEWVIYSYWYEQQANALTVLRAQGKLPFKWITRAHGYDVDRRQRQNGLIPFRHWMLKHKPNHIVSISDFGATIFKKDYGVEVNVAKLGTPDLGLAPIPQHEDELIIVSISSVIALKRVDLIIDLLSKVEKKVKWIHYGSGPLEKELHWHKLPTNVSLEKKGNVLHEDLLNELKQTPIDFMLHLSGLEGIPVSIMECMSLGIPVIACDTGGVSEIVNDDNGWLLPINFDTMKVVGLIDSFYEDKRELIKKRHLARKSWEQEYQASVNFPKFIDTYLS